MAMALSDLRDEVRYIIKRTKEAFPDTRITTYINWAQLNIADEHTYEEMRTVWSATTVEIGGSRQRYPFPTNMKDIYSLVIVDGTESRKLKYVNARNFDTVVPYPAAWSTGTPTHYIDYGANFELWRIPDADYVMLMRCSLYPTEFSSDTDTSDLQNKDQLMVALASAKILRALRELEDAEYWQGEADRLTLLAHKSDHNAEDWVPIHRGFTIGYEGPGLIYDETSPWTALRRR